MLARYRRQRLRESILNQQHLTKAQKHGVVADVENSELLRNAAHEGALFSRCASSSRYGNLPRQF